MIQKCCAFLLYRLLGWRLSGEIPYQQKKLMIVFVPHTSNWDFVVGWLLVRAEDLQVTIFAKDQFDFFPFTYAYSFFGVVPIKRHKSANFVEQATQLYQQENRFWGAMAPEGTRGYIQQLKSGYYYLAKAANVQLLVVGLDFKKKTVVIEPLRNVLPTFDQDVVCMSTFGKSIHAKIPSQNFAS